MGELLSERSEQRRATYHDTKYSYREGTRVSLSRPPVDVMDHRASPPQLLAASSQLDARQFKVGLFNQLSTDLRFSRSRRASSVAEQLTLMRVVSPSLLKPLYAPGLAAWLTRVSILGIGGRRRKRKSEARRRFKEATRAVGRDWKARLIEVQRAWVAAVR